MNQAANNYVKFVKFCLTVLSCPVQEDGEYMEAFLGICRIYKQSEGALELGLITEEQCKAIGNVFDEMDKLTHHKLTLKLHTDQAYLTGPEWGATKAAARQGLTLFEETAS